MGDEKHKSAARSAAMKRWWAALSPEERTAYQKRRFAGMTPEERSARQRLTHPGISERVSRQMFERWAKCTGEERARKCAHLTNPEAQAKSHAAQRTPEFQARRSAWSKAAWNRVTEKERAGREHMTEEEIREVLEARRKAVGRFLAEARRRKRLERDAQEARELAERRRVEREAEEWCRLHKVCRSRRDGNGAGDVECQGNVN